MLFLKRNCSIVSHLGEEQHGGHDGDSEASSGLTAAPSQGWLNGDDARADDCHDPVEKAALQRRKFFPPNRELWGLVCLFATEQR